MNRTEARRFAHRLAADILSLHGLDRIRTVATGEDADLITTALLDLAEHHERFGPKTTDRSPSLHVYETPLLQGAFPAGPDPDGA